MDFLKNTYKMFVMNIRFIRKVLIDKVIFWNYDITFNTVKPVSLSPVSLSFLKNLAKKCFFTFFSVTLLTVYNFLNKLIFRLQSKLQLRDLELRDTLRGGYMIIRGFWGFIIVELIVMRILRLIRLGKIKWPYVS